MWRLSGFADEIDADLDTQCRVLDELGISLIELRSAWGVNVLDLTDDQLETVRSTLDAHGIAVSSIGSPLGKIPVADDFEPHRRRAARAVDVAERLGAPVIRVFSFFLPEGEDPDGFRDEVLRRIDGMVAEAKGHDVVLAHENEKEIYGDIPRRCVDIVESIGSDQLRLTFDAANFVQCGVRPHDEGYEPIRPYLEYVQVKDAIADSGQVVEAGAGDGQVRETLAALVADGFDGVFSLEPHLGTVERTLIYSGPELFTKAANAFTGLLDEKGVAYR